MLWKKNNFSTETVLERLLLFAKINSHILVLHNQFTENVLINAHYSIIMTVNWVEEWINWIVWRHCYYTCKFNSSAGKFDIYWRSTFPIVGFPYRIIIRRILFRFSFYKKNKEGILKLVVVFIKKMKRKSEKNMEKKYEKKFEKSFKLVFFLKCYYRYLEMVTFWTVMLNICNI